jgi:hypothetical protein
LLAEAFMVFTGALSVSAVVETSFILLAISTKVVFETDTGLVYTRSEGREGRGGEEKR